MPPNERCAASPSAGKRGCSAAPTAAMYSLIVTAKMNDLDPQAWLADVLARINDLPQTKLHELLPWEWKRLRETTTAT